MTTKLVSIDCLDCPDVETPYGNKPVKSAGGIPYTEADICMECESADNLYDSCMGCPLEPVWIKGIPYQITDYALYVCYQCQGWLAMGKVNCMDCDIGCEIFKHCPVTKRLGVA